HALPTRPSSDLNGNWSTSVTLSNGSNSLTAQVSDLAGNPATSSPVVYTLSTTAPTLSESLAFDTGASALDHITSNDALSGTGLANTVVHFTIDGSPIATTVRSEEHTSELQTRENLVYRLLPDKKNQTD